MAGNFNKLIFTDFCQIKGINKYYLIGITIQKIYLKKQYRFWIKEVPKLAALYHANYKKKLLVVFEFM